MTLVVDTDDIQGLEASHKMITTLCRQFDARVESRGMDKRFSKIAFIKALRGYMKTQQDAVESEDIEFSVMLPNINLLYLFCGVLILLDGSYMSRFWTQFEAFLSFRKVTASGLGPAPETERRDAIVCIHNADSEFDPPKLRKMWGDVTVDEAHDVLAKPDVTVTNQKDKDTQLPKLKRLNDFAKSSLADLTS